MRVVEMKDQVEGALKNLIYKSEEENVDLTADSDYSSSFVELIGHALDDQVFVSVIYLYRAMRCIDFLLENEFVEGNGESFRERQQFLCNQRDRIEQIAYDRLDDS